MSGMPAKNRTISFSPLTRKAQKADMCGALTRCLLWANSGTFPFSGVNTTLNSHQRGKTTSRAALHCEEITRLAVLRHPRILP
jgi:hypothetical protein